MEARHPLPDYVYFHHGVHVHAGIACEECHGVVDDMPRIQRVHRMTMDCCLDCHRDRNGSHRDRAAHHLLTCHRCIRRADSTLGLVRARSSPPKAVPQLIVPR